MDRVEQFVTEYIQREYTIPAEQDIMELNYVESGYVGSLGLIQFIATIEDEFLIEFSENELENPNIRIIGRLIEIIKAKMAGLDR